MTRFSHRSGGRGGSVGYSLSRSACQSLVLVWSIHCIFIVPCAQAEPIGGADGTANATPMGPAHSGVNLKARTISSTSFSSLGGFPLKHQRLIWTGMAFCEIRTGGFVG